MAVAGCFGGRGGRGSVADINTAGREPFSSEIVRLIGILLYGYGNALLTIIGDDFGLQFDKFTFSIMILVKT